MPISLQDGTGSGFFARVNTQGRLLVDADFNEDPGTGYNPQTILVYSGAAIGSIYKTTNTGSYLKVLSYDGSDNLIGVSAWAVV
jgi:hypothetical protein